MRRQVLTSVALTNDADGIFESQTRVGAGALTLNGVLVSSGVAYLYGATSETRFGQKISITGTGNNSGISATITGLGPGKSPYTEVITLANNGTVTTTGYFWAVSSITVSGTVTGNIVGGWLSTVTLPAASAPLILDRQQLPGNTSLTVYLSTGASLTYLVQHTVDDPQANYGTSNFSASARWLNTDGLTTLTASDDSNYAYNVCATRIVIGPYTSGTLDYIVIQGNPF